MQGLTGVAGLDAGSVAAFAARGARLLAGGTPRADPGPVALLFAEPSTRTRVSFSEAVSRLGGRPVALDGAGSSLAKGEGMVGSARALASLGIRGLVLRTGETGLPARLLAADPGLWVVNAGDGSGEHPTQALGDTLTLVANGGLEGRKVALIGDLAGSRVAHSLLLLWPRLGVEVGALAVDVGAADLPVVPVPGAKPLASLAEAEGWADVLYLLRPQVERLAGAARAGWEAGGGMREAYHEAYGVKGLAKGQSVMAPGPSWPGVEMAAGLALGPGSLVLDQVRWGLGGRMALIERLAGG